MPRQKLMHNVSTGELKIIDFTAEEEIQRDLEEAAALAETAQRNTEKLERDRRQARIQARIDSGLLSLEKEDELRQLLDKG